MEGEEHATSLRSPTDSTHVIHFERVGKRYRSWTGREVLAVQDFSLHVRAGEVFGVAGPNGAGKSTLIALLLGFLGPSTGAVRIDGLPPRRFIERQGVGYVPELINIPPAWRVRDTVYRYALLAGVGADSIGARIDESLATLGLEEHRGKRVRQLSKGNLQRLGLAQALLCAERLIVFDEPTHGLDPVWTQRFREIVNGLRRADRTILIASHNLDELARVADRVAIVDRGRLQRIVDVRANERTVTENAPYRIVVARGEARLRESFPAAREISAGEFEVTGLSLGAINAGLVSLIAAGVVVSAVFPVHSALEQQFRDAVGARPSREEPS